MKTFTRKIPVLRYFVIVLMFSVLFVSAFYLYLHYKKAQGLRSNIESLISAREKSALIDTCIINLYGADNYSRLYTITGNKVYLKKFMDDINKISAIIDTIKFNPHNVSESDPIKFRDLMKKKTEATDSYMKLRLLTDSLIKSSTRINISFNKFAQHTTQPTVKVEHVISTDTIKQDKPRKKLLGRIFAAFSAKKQETNSPVVVQKDTVTTTTTLTNNTVANKALYKNYYKKLNNVNDRLLANERQMVIINNNLIEEIITSLRLYKAMEQLYIKGSKTEVKENLAYIYEQFKGVSMLNIIFLISLLIIMFYNIWKIFKNEQEIIEYSEKAEQYALSKSRFLAGMSHEIRTPLNSVIGFSEQLQQENLSKTQKEQVAAIRSSSEMLLELVNEILDFSKYETGKITFESNPFMLGNVVNEVFTGMNIHALKKNIILKNDIRIDDELCCEGDKMRLKQVIMNLVGNAIKFTVKGSVTLSAYTVKETDDNVVFKVRVIDTGLGIDKANLANIFEEFSQVANAQKATRHKGTGLGLAICKKIIELQGGAINVRSVPGRGSVFSFELPLKKCEKVEDAIEAGLSDEHVAELLRDKTILFVEDNKLNVLLGSTILKKWKVKYDVAYNGIEALHLFSQNEYDLVLTDIQMPEMGGLELTTNIRKFNDPLKSNIPIIALTANVMKEDRDLYLKTGMNEVILKPFLEKDLIGKIAQTIYNTESVEKFIMM